MRILPRKNNSINENWITDQIRFVCDAFKKQRLLIPYARLGKIDKIIPISWNIAYSYVLENFTVLQCQSRILPIYVNTSMYSDLGTIHAAKEFCRLLGISKLNIDLFKIPLKTTSDFFFNTALESIEFSNIFIVTGLHLRNQFPILNLKIKKSTKNSSFQKRTKILYFGSAPSLNFDILHLGHSPKFLLFLRYGKIPLCTLLVKKVDVTNLSNLKRIFSYSMPTKICSVNSSFLSCNTGDLGALFLNATPYCKVGSSDTYFENPSIIYSIDGLVFRKYVKNSFHLYQGSFFFDKVIQSSLFLPSKNFTEGTFHYVNLEGRFQYANKAVTSPGQSEHPSSIIESLLFFLISRLFIRKGYFNTSIRLNNFI